MSSSLVSIEDLTSLCRLQFEAMGLPRVLHDVASRKILSQAFDAGDAMQFADEGDEDESEDEGVEESDEEEVSMDTIISSLRSTRYALVAKDSLRPEQDVYLVDHMWTTTFPQTRKHLLEIPGLLQRIGIYCISSNLTLISSNLQDCSPESALNLPVREEGSDSEAAIDAALDRLWTVFNCYTLPGNEYTRWFLMDEGLCTSFVIFDSDMNVANDIRTHY